MSQTLLEIEHLIPSAKLPIGIGSSFDSDELGGLLRALDALLVRFGSVLTQRREALDRLAASEAGYRALVSTQDGLVARITPDGRLSFVNDAYCCYYGRRRDEILGHTYNEFTLTISEDRERDTMHLSSLTPEHPSAIIELRRQLPNGGMRYVQWTDTALFDAGGQLVEVQSVGRDVTDRIAAEPRFWCVGA